ncbi:unnamed protein product [Peniophora sp. CBMAI 1063]|nr:unnamed protein product [Peniophora sp. CBMAI 1063]
MVDSMSPPQIQESLHQLTAFETSLLVFCGIYFLEYILHLRFDWSLFKGPGAPRHGLSRVDVALVTRWTYLIDRLLLLAFSVAGVTLMISDQRDCQALAQLLGFAGLSSLVCGWILLSIRVCVIWNWDKRVAVLLILMILASIALAIRCVVELSAAYNHVFHACIIDRVPGLLTLTVSLLAGESVVLLGLFVGLQSKWRGARQFRMWNVLWTQGLLHFAFCLAMRIPLVVLLARTTSPIAELIVLTPTFVMGPIGAMHMFRYLQTSVRGDRSPQFGTRDLPMRANIQLARQGEAGSKQALTRHVDANEEVRLSGFAVCRQ